MEYNMNKIYLRVLEEYINSDEEPFFIRIYHFPVVSKKISHGSTSKNPDILDLRRCFFKVSTS